VEGADIYQIAKNCHTSVEMIEKYYAAHIKTSPRRRCDQPHAAQEKQERQESHPEHSSAIGTRGTGNGCVNLGNVPYHKIAEVRQPRAGVAEWHTQRT
jgi:hypothetical protein